MTRISSGPGSSVPGSETALLLEKADGTRLYVPILLAVNGLVLPCHDGTIWKPDLFTAAFRRFAKDVGLGHFRFHDLRHSHATQLLKAGIHPKIVSERLGHSTIAITLDTYSHVMPGMREDAADRLNEALETAIQKRN